MVSPTFQITFDCADPDALAHFWAEALAYKMQDPPEGFSSWADWLTAHGMEDDNSASAIVDPEDRRPRFYFQRVPEGKTAKNRVHLDINLPGARGISDLDERRGKLEAEAARLESVGAKKIDYFVKGHESWIIMNDPEGNEFCLQ